MLSIEQQKLLLLMKQDGKITKVSQNIYNNQVSFYNAVNRLIEGGLVIAKWSHELKRNEYELGFEGHIFTNRLRMIT